jgi:hypothetical protein
MGREEGEEEYEFVMQQWLNQALRLTGRLESTFGGAVTS